jgi:hypothetical protein
MRPSGRLALTGWTLGFLRCRLRLALAPAAPNKGPRCRTSARTPRCRWSGCFRWKLRYSRQRLNLPDGLGFHRGIPGRCLRSIQHLTDGGDRLMRRQVGERLLARDPERLVVGREGRSCPWRSRPANLSSRQLGSPSGSTMHPIPSLRSSSPSCSLIQRTRR